MRLRKKSLDTERREIFFFRSAHFHTPPPADNKPMLHQCKGHLYTRTFIFYNFIMMMGSWLLVFGLGGGTKMIIKNLVLEAGFQPVLELS